MPAIGLLGDVMLGRSVGDHLRATPAAELWSDELRSLCASLDLMICNLECAVSERGERTRRIPGKPFFFRAPLLRLRYWRRSMCGRSRLRTTTLSTTRGRR